LDKPHAGFDLDHPDIFNILIRPVRSGRFTDTLEGHAFKGISHVVEHTVLQAWHLIVVLHRKPSLEIVCALSCIIVPQFANYYKPPTFHIPKEVAHPRQCNIAYLLALADVDNIDVLALWLNGTALVPATKHQSVPEEYGVSEFLWRPMTHKRRRKPVVFPVRLVYPRDPRMPIENRVSENLSLGASLKH
jgi:hypothetical protein